jgi:lipid A 3-O-deacylase
MTHHLPLKTMIVAAVLAATTHASFAADSYSAEVATGNKSQIYRLGAQFNMSQSWLRSANSEVWGYWDATIADWRENKYRNVTGATKDFIDIGFTPTLRWQTLNHQGAYFEAGLGPHLNSDVYNNDGRRLSTNLQFGTHLGIGYVTNGGLDLAIKVQHFSNGGIKHPNSGVNLAIAKVGYKF